MFACVVCVVLWKTSSSSRLRLCCAGWCCWLCLLLQLLRQQVQDVVEKAAMKAVAAAPGGFVEDQLHKVLGSGGFGTVYLGKWKGSTAAIKVRGHVVFRCAILLGRPAR